ncbi:lipoyl synthase [bacterium]|nr:lipoyl synthase [bacterium]
MDNNCAWQQIDADEIKEIPKPGTPEWQQNLRRPAWLRTSLRTDKTYGRVASILRQGGLCTVCREAQCPNRQECWSEGTATFMILGKVCTRACRYCAVSHGGFEDARPDEPEQVAQAVEAMGLRFAVVTSVTRDDLPDGGAEHFAQTIMAIRLKNPNVGVEVLIPDFAGSEAALECVLLAEPRVLNHNMETVERLFPLLRPQGNYRRSLELLGRADSWRKRSANAEKSLLLKSGLMVGLGETRRELLQTMDDLRERGVDMLTLGQYLRPSLQQVPVMRYWSPEEYEDLRQEGLKRGFKSVEAGVFVRSSYHAANSAQINRAK